MSDISVCPRCDSANIQHIRSSAYQCRECDAPFYQPRYRRSNSTNNLHGLAKKLDEANPDEVSRE